MSVFRKTTLTCPACAAAVPFDEVFSVNADRRPDLRAAVLAETFQSRDCPQCGKTFRLAPDLNYLDVGRGQWLAAHPIDAAGRWKEIEDHDRAVFAKAFGADAPAAARIIGDRLAARITFGWPGLREKVVIREKDLDDVTVELVKMAIVRGMDESPLDQDTELRLVNADADTLYLIWFRVPSEQFVEGLKVPRGLYDEVTEDADDWAALRAEFDGALYVDMSRLLIPAEPVAD